MKIKSNKCFCFAFVFIILGTLACQNAYAGDPSANELRKQAAILREKINLCQQDIANGANDCLVKVPWENRKVSMTEAENLIAQYLNEAQNIDAASNVANWSGNWDKEEKDLVCSALRGLKDERLRNWMSANVQFKRFKDDNFSPLTAYGSVLRFKDDFFSRVTTDTTRENLLAFEAGKVFFGNMKDQPVQGGTTLEQWFIGYYGGHMSAISDMKATKHNKESLPTSDIGDAYSSFAHIFRAQALQLKKPTGEKALKEWNRVIREFQAHTDPFLQGK